jgi:pimeloyl-ACP methyl ester carboxylesterase
MATGSLSGRFAPAVGGWPVSARAHHVRAERDERHSGDQSFGSRGRSAQLNPDQGPHTAAGYASKSISSSISAPVNFIQVDGLKIAHKVVGEGEPIIFLARFRGTLNDWDPAFVDAVAKRYRVILFDAPGVGRSGGIVQTSVTTWADQAVKFTRALGIDHSMFLGWSMGGAVAQIVAVNHPTIVDKLVLLATGPSGNSEFVPANPEFGARARKPVYDFDDYQFLFFYSSETAKAACASYLKRVALIEDKDIPATPESYHNMSIAMADFKGNKERNYFSALKDIDKPVLIANGKFDPSYPLMNSYVLEREIPNSKLIVYPDAGHGFLFQHQREFVPELLAFLA